MTFRMFGSFNQSDVAISTAVVATGIWNMGFKFGLPIVAVTLVLLTGGTTAGTLALATLGVVIIVVAGIVIWLTLRDDRSAQAVGRLGDRAGRHCLHWGEVSLAICSRYTLRRLRAASVVCLRGHVPGLP